MQYENKIFSQGVQRIAGIDEAGRGAWAGPLVAAAILVSPDNLLLLKKIRFIRDSKLLSALQRKRAYNFLAKNFLWAYGAVDSSFIDEYGLTAANQEVMNRALQSLKLAPDYILVDGRGFRFDIPYKNIIDGDAKIKCISAASILAKVTRDTMMVEYHKEFKKYAFHRHKGYGTRLHQKRIAKHGICPIHRRSFHPIRGLVMTGDFSYTKE